MLRLLSRIIFVEATSMNPNKLLCILFSLAGICFLFGTLNHILHTGEGILSSLLLAAGCFCFAYFFSKKK